jgi:hypothetical protein
MTRFVCVFNVIRSFQKVLIIIIPLYIYEINSCVVYLYLPGALEKFSDANSEAIRFLVYQRKISFCVAVFCSLWYILTLVVEFTREYFRVMLFYYIL